MIINHNMSALNTNRQLGVSELSGQKNMEKLSSGMRINRAGDDASGLAVSEKMRSQIRGLNQAERNIQDGISFVQTTEGYLQETQDILQRMRELSVQSANGIYTAEDRMQIQVEVSQLVDEIDRIASHAQFNGMNMLTGRFTESEANGTAGLKFQVGANIDQFESVSINDMSASALGIIQSQQGQEGTQSSGVSLTSAEDANLSLDVLDKALMQVSKQRADLGAYQNRFEHAAKGVSVASENLQAAESHIRDVNMASEMVDFTKNQILQQAGTAMLAQANVRSQAALQLLS